MIEDIEHAGTRITNHVVLCGIGSHNGKHASSTVDQFLKVLRSDYLPFFPPVVILQQHLPDQRTLERYAALKDVWIVQVAEKRPLSERVMCCADGVAWAVRVAWCVAFVWTAACSPVSHRCCVGAGFTLHLR